MTDDALSVVSLLFGSVFRLFNSWYIPGTNVTPAVALFGILFITVMFKIAGHVLGLWGDKKE